jgi:hypothetical protein
MTTVYFVFELASGEVKKTEDWHRAKPFFTQPEYTVLVVEEGICPEYAHVVFNRDRKVVAYLPKGEFK